MPLASPEAAEFDPIVGAYVLGASEDAQQPPGIELGSFRALD